MKQRINRAVNVRRQHVRANLCAVHIQPLNLTALNLDPFDAPEFVALLLGKLAKSLDLDESPQVTARRSYTLSYTRGLELGRPPTYRGRAVRRLALDPDPERRAVRVGMGRAGSSMAPAAVVRVPLAHHDTPRPH